MTPYNLTVLIIDMNAPGSASHVSATHFPVGWRWERLSLSLRKRAAGRLQAQSRRTASQRRGCLLIERMKIILFEGSDSLGS